MVTAEDHWREGGLGEAVLSVFAESDERPRIRVLAVRDMPGSGTGPPTSSTPPASTPLTLPQLLVTWWPDAPPRPPPVSRWYSKQETLNSAMGYEELPQWISSAASAS